MHNVTKYYGMLAAIHCEELTETATKTANMWNLSHSEPENHLFISFACVGRPSSIRWILIY